MPTTSSGWPLASTERRIDPPQHPRRGSRVNPPIRAVALTLLLLAGGCRAPGAGPAAPGISPHALLTRTPPPAGRACALAPLPATLPAADLLIDSLHFVDAVARYRVQSEVRGYVLVSLAFDAHGTSIRRHVIEHDVPRAAADTLQRLVFAHRRHVEPGDAWGARLRVDVGDTVSLRVGRQLHCEPRPRMLPDEVASHRGDDAWSVQRRMPLPTRPAQRTVVRVLVDERGHAAEMQVVGGIVGIHREQALTNLLHGLSFDPATLDGVPVPGWVTLTVQHPLR
jgi:hypothetical protein